MKTSSQVVSQEDKTWSGSSADALTPVCAMPEVLQLLHRAEAPGGGRPVELQRKDRLPGVKGRAGD